MEFSIDPNNQDDICDTQDEIALTETKIREYEIMITHKQLENFHLQRSVNDLEMVQRINTANQKRTIGLKEIVFQLRDKLNTLNESYTNFNFSDTYNYRILTKKLECNNLLSIYKSLIRQNLALREVYEKSAIVKEILAKSALHKSKRERFNYVCNKMSKEDIRRKNEIRTVKSQEMLYIVKLVENSAKISKFETESKESKICSQIGRDKSLHLLQEEEAVLKAQLIDISHARIGSNISNLQSSMTMPHLFEMMWRVKYKGIQNPNCALLEPINTTHHMNISERIQSTPSVLQSEGKNLLSHELKNNSTLWKSNIGHCDTDDMIIDESNRTTDSIEIIDLVSPNLQERPLTTVKDTFTLSDSYSSLRHSQYEEFSNVVKNISPTSHTKQNEKSVMASDPIQILEVLYLVPPRSDAPNNGSHTIHELSTAKSASATVRKTAHVEDVGSIVGQSKVLDTFFPPKQRRNTIDEGHSILSTTEQVTPKSILKKNNVTEVKSHNRMVKSSLAEKKPQTTEYFERFSPNAFSDEVNIDKPQKVDMPSKQKTNKAKIDSTAMSDDFEKFFTQNFQKSDNNQATNFNFGEITSSQPDVGFSETNDFFNTDNNSVFNFGLSDNDNVDTTGFEL